MRRQYLVMKTGFAMCDVYHVYGVAFLLREALARAPGPIDGYITVEDVGIAWRVESPDTGLGPDVAKKVASTWTELVKQSLGQQGAGEDSLTSTHQALARAWRHVHATVRMSGEAAISKAEEYGENLGRCLGGLISGQGSVTDLYPADLMKAEGSVLQGLEVAAGKGNRKRTRASYGEENYQRPKALLTVACAGALAVGGFYWLGGAGGAGVNLAVVPVPQKITFEDHLEVRAEVATRGRLCPVSVNTALAHYAVRLGVALAARKASQSPRRPVYSALAFETMIQTGQQPKPGRGGMYPLDTIEAMIEQDAGAAQEVFRVWDSLLAAGAARGCELLALTLAEFLAHPTLENIERHWRVHLRLSLSEQANARHIKPLRYPQEAIEGVMRSVSS